MSIKLEKNKKVFFLTGIRSEYDILAPVIDKVSQTPGLDAGVVVTGAHLVDRMGYSVSQVEKDGFNIVARIDSLLSSDNVSGRVKGAAMQIAGLTDLFASNTPDFFVVMGDREEAMTGALAALYHHIPIVHLGGGDHAEDGNVDNPIRHAVSKLANLHMVTTELSASRLRALGEEDWRINVTGASGLDRLISTPYIDRKQVFEKLELDWGDEPYMVLLYHPTITDFSNVKTHISSILSAIELAGVNVIAMMPNSDPGNAPIISALEMAAVKRNNFHLVSYLDRLFFVNLLRHAHAMIGNSSAGILEAPTLGLPVINIGVRQTGREHAENVVFIGYEIIEIVNAIKQAVFDKAYREKVRNCLSPYGDGRASDRITDILVNTKIDTRLMHKRFIMDQKYA